MNASQQVVAAYRYDPFGTLLAKTGTFDQPFQFSTKRYDARIGMVQYEFRNYLPHLGRWATRDPLGEAGGLNLYAFVGNNPVNWVDPWGLYRSPEWARRWLPWVPAMDLALTNFENGNVFAGIGNAATSLAAAALVTAPITVSPAVQQMACSVQMGAGVAEAAELPQGGRWLSPTEWANSVANDLLRAAKLSGIGAGAHSGQHGRPYAAAARQLQELAKDTGLLPEVRFQLVIKAQEFLMKAKEINHPGR